MHQNGQVLILCLVLVLATCEESEPIFPNAGNEDLNIEQLMKTVNLIEHDIEGMASQFSSMFMNILKKYESEGGTNNITEDGRVDWQEMIHMANFGIQQLSKVEEFLHKQLNEGGDMKGNEMYQYGGYLVLAGIAYKMFSIKRVLNMFFA